MLGIETGPPEEQPVLVIAKHATSPAPPSAFFFLRMIFLGLLIFFLLSKALFFKLLSSYLTLPHCFFHSNVETDSDLFSNNEKKPSHQLPLTLLLLYIL